LAWSEEYSSVIPPPSPTDRIIVVGRVSKSHYVAIERMMLIFYSDRLVLVLVLSLIFWLYSSVLLFCAFLINSAMPAPPSPGDAAPALAIAPAPAAPAPSSPSPGENRTAAVVPASVLPPAPEEASAIPLGQGALLKLINQLAAKVNQQQQQLQRQQQTIEKLLLPPPQSIAEKASKSTNADRGLGINGKILLSQDEVTAALKVKAAEKAEKDKAAAERKRKREEKAKVKEDEAAARSNKRQKVSQVKALKQPSKTRDAAAAAGPKPLAVPPALALAPTLLPAPSLPALPAPIRALPSLPPPAAAAVNFAPADSNEMQVDTEPAAPAAAAESRPHRAAALNNRFAQHSQK
jgi:hypothetical protein